MRPDAHRAVPEGRASFPIVDANPTRAPDGRPGVEDHRAGVTRRDVVRAGLIGVMGLSVGVIGWRAAGPDHPAFPSPGVRALVEHLRQGRTLVAHGPLFLEIPAHATPGQDLALGLTVMGPLAASDAVFAIHCIVDGNRQPHLWTWEPWPALGACTLENRIRVEQTGWVRVLAERAGGDLLAAYAHVDLRRRQDG